MQRKLLGVSQKRYQRRAERSQAVSCDLSSVSGDVTFKELSRALECGNKLLTPGRISCLFLMHLCTCTYA